MFQHSCSEIGSVRKQVLIHFNIIETHVCKTKTRLCHKKDIFIPLAFVSDKIIPFFATQSVILQCLY